MIKKKVILLLISLVGLSFVTYFITVNNYKSYNTNYNELIYKIIDNDDVSKDTVVTVLNKDKNIDENLLTDYGYNINDLNIVKKNYDKLNKNIFINIISINSISTLIFGIYLLIDYKISSDINKLIKYINNINLNKFKLEIETNDNNELSLLKNELYKITAALKEHTNKLNNDKKLIKNNIADISHQLKTPITGILIMIDNILDNKDMEQSTKEEFLKDIKDKTIKLENLIYELLKLSKFDANAIEFNNKLVAIDLLIEKSIDNVGILADNKNININYNKNNIKLNIDLKWQIEAISNILKNAIENSFNNSNIDIKITDNNFYTKIEITDFGKGISNDKLNLIFNRFYRDENSLKNSMGIGLNLAKTIINKNSGTIEVKSILGKTTTFTIKYFK